MRKAEARKAAERKAAKQAASKAKRTTTRKPMATRKIEAALQAGKLTDADLATFKKFGMSDAQIAALVAKKE